MPHTLHVISHTHWDREWYLPFQLFRMKLVDLLDHLLEILETRPEFKHFNLDAQTIVLEDYLQIRPHRADTLRKHIQAGRILIGPWYQLNDENLVSGESTIRSLLIGHRIASQFGPVMKVGYLPDQFGNISQMPQILRGFGIDNAIFGRGRQLTGDRKMEFVWRSPDGSEVFASLMAFWYNNAQRFPSDPDEALSYTQRIIDVMAPVAASRHLLLMNGVDHLEAQPDVGEIIDAVQKRLADADIRHSTLPEYIHGATQDLADRRVELERVTGELREDRHCNVLAGTLSTRMYLKQANTECEMWLERQAEPASVMSRLAGGRWDKDILRFAWKRLMENHPHDSICGCSVDTVHDEMMTRFGEVRQVAEETTRRRLLETSSAIHSDGPGLVVYNTLNWPRTERVRAVIDFPISDTVRGAPTIDLSKDVWGLELRDPAGNQVPFVVTECRKLIQDVYSPVELPMARWVRRYLVEFVARDVPGCGYRLYTINPNVPTPVFDRDHLYHAEDTLANEYLTINSDAGGVEVYTAADTDENTVLLQNVGMLEDVGDRGDEYRYVRPLRDERITTLQDGAAVRILDGGPVYASLVRRSVMHLPKSVTDDKNARSDELVACPVTITWTLTAGVPRVDVRVEFENTASDHRLRALVPTWVESDQVHAEMPFDVVERAVRPPDDWPNASSFFPQRSWVDISDGVRGVAVINKGLPEYEVYPDAARTLGLTLLRCVGCISDAGDTASATPTPGAQCLGRHVAEYAVMPHSGTWEDAQIWKQAHSFNTPMLVCQVDAQDGPLPAEYQFLKVEGGDGLIVSACKPAEDSDAVIVRLFNIASTAVTARVAIPGVQAAEQVNLNEESITPLEIDSAGAVSLPVSSRQIVTLAFHIG